MKSCLKERPQQVFLKEPEGGLAPGQAEAGGQGQERGGARRSPREGLARRKVALAFGMDDALLL